MTSYQTLFDASTVPFRYGGAAFLLVVAALSIWWGFHRLRQVDYNFFADYRTFKSTATLLVGAGLIMFIGHDWWDHQAAQAAIARGEGTRQVEGVVQDHWIKEQTRETGDKVRIDTIEHFRIAHVDFEFAQTRSQQTYFTNAADHFVKLRDGMRLRVIYVAAGDTNQIVKLEAAE